MSNLEDKARLLEEGRLQGIREALEAVKNNRPTHSEYFTRELRNLLSTSSKKLLGIDIFDEGDEEDE